MSESRAGDAGGDGNGPAEPTQGAPAASVGQIEDIITDLVRSSAPSSQSIYRRLAQEPREPVVQVLSVAVQRQTEWNLYARVANMLGRLDDAHSLQVLRSEIVRKSPFAIHAVRALGRMTVEGAEDVLWDIVKTGRVAHRRSAARSLARRRVGRVVAPLCRMARRSRSKEPDRDLIEAIRSMGRLRDLIVYLLTDSTIDTTTRVEAMEDLEALQRHLRLGRLNILGILQRDAAEPRCPWQEAASEAADLYYARRMLLRPADRLSSDTLLRPASGPDRTPPELLVRPVEEAADPVAAEERSGLLQRVMRRIKDALDGD